MSHPRDFRQTVYFERFDQPVAFQESLSFRLEG